MNSTIKEHIANQNTFIESLLKDAQALNIVETGKILINQGDDNKISSILDKSAKIDAVISNYKKTLTYSVRLINLENNSRGNPFYGITIRYPSEFNHYRDTSPRTTSNYFLQISYLPNPIRLAAIVQIRTSIIEDFHRKLRVDNISKRAHHNYSDGTDFLAFFINEFEMVLKDDMPLDITAYIDTKCINPKTKKFIEWEYRQKQDISTYVKTLQPV